jgi:hypothetical protein
MKASGIRRFFARMLINCFVSWTLKLLHYNTCVGRMSLL